VIANIRWLALALVAVLAYMLVGEDVSLTLRRRARVYRVKYGQYFTRSALIPAIVMAVLAVFMRDVILSPFLLVIGLVIAYYRIRQNMAEATKITPRQVLQLVLSFRGAYQLQPAVFKSLQEANKKIETESILRDLVNVSVETFFLTSSPERAFAEFRKRTDNILLHQFIYILEMSESASDTSMAEALDAFVARLHRQANLRNQVETGLVGVTQQTRFLQIVIVVVAFVVVAVPYFRDVYASGVFGRFGFMAIVVAILATSYHIEKQVDDLKKEIK